MELVGAVGLMTEVLTVQEAPERVKLLTTAEVARLLGRHPKTVERMIRDGRLRATRLSGASTGPWGVRPEWVDELIDASETASAEPRPLPVQGRARGRGRRLAVRPGMGRAA